MFHAELRGGARQARDALSLRERAEVDRLISLIEIDPWIDGMYKVGFPVPPLILTLYDNGSWRIAYHITSNEAIWVMSIARVTPE